jgi:GAF domain-containing protein
MDRTVQEKHIVQEETDEGYRLAVPIAIRDTVIAVIDTYKPPGAGAWTDDEVSLLQGLADEIGTTLESARLYQNTQRQAAQEQLLSEITARFTSSLELNAILRSAVRELGQLPNVTEAVVHLGAAEDGASGELEPASEGEGR